MFELIIGFLLGMLSTVVFHLYSFYVNKQRANKMLRIEVDQLNHYIGSIMKAKPYLNNGTFHNITPKFDLVSVPTELQYLKEPVATSVIKINGLLKQTENFRLTGLRLSGDGNYKAQLKMANTQYLDYVSAADREMKILLGKLK